LLARTLLVGITACHFESILPIVQFQLTTIPGLDAVAQPKLPFSHYLNPLLTLDDFRLSSSVLEKRFNVLDISTSDSYNTMCFTKSYSKYLEGTGSVYYEKTRDELNQEIAEIERNDMDIKLKEALNLRFFSPDEVARLMCFPQDFKFPDSLAKTTAYKLIGNSICIKVVSELIKVLCQE
jgi:tRNA (cytosine38-C5)-methyltransferase